MTFAQEAIRVLSIRRHRRHLQRRQGSPCGQMFLGEEQGQGASGSRRYQRLKVADSEGVKLSVGFAEHNSA